MARGRLSRLARPLVDGAAAVTALGRSGMLSPVRPDRMLAMALSYGRWGASPATTYAAGAARDPRRNAVVDERSSLTYADVDAHSTAVARGLAARGVHAGDAVALLARNSAAFVVAQVALCKLGADVLYVNTGFAAPQLADVLRGEGAVAVVADDEFAPMLDVAARGLPRVRAWVDDVDDDTESIAALAREPADELHPPGRESRHIILTSGTTGRPKGAARSAPTTLSGLIEPVALLEAIPYRARGTTILAAPAFHAWGLANLLLASALQSTLVLRRRFDPAATLALVEAHRADTLVAVPVMVQRLLDLPRADIHRHDYASLRVVALSGSALPASLATRFMDEFGDVLYSLYGSTEVAYVSVAGPADLRAAPSCAGRVVRGVKVRLVDADGRDVAPGDTGRIFAGNAMVFEGYTSGEDKARLGGLTSTGDVGRFDAHGRLYVEGRDDDMIVSGGENVFPAEVEDCLHRHPEVTDAAVVGVADASFGQALVAHVVLRAGATVTPDDLRAHVRRELARYKVPREVVVHDELPRNETGKVVKRALGSGTSGSGASGAGGTTSG